MGVLRQSGPDLASSRTMSRSDRMPSAVLPFEDTTTAPIRRAARRLAASDTLASGSNH